MNLLILLTLIPLSFAVTAPDCKELGQILQGFETKIQKDNIKDCKDDLYSKLTEGTPVVDKEFLKGKVCQDLNTIETQLTQARMELAVLNGLHQIVKTVDINKEKAKKENPSGAKVNTHPFVVSLNTAQSFEVLLQSVTAEKKPFMKALKDFDPSKLLTERDLKDRVNELCKGQPKNEKDACNPNIFKPGKEASEELIGLIKNSDPTIPQISSWQQQLAIKRKNAKPNEESYTFTDMQIELGSAFEKIDANEVMTKGHLDAIKKLDDFEFDSKLSFVQNIAGMKGKTNDRTASDKFLLLMGDAKLRSQFETQSKLSILWQDVENFVPSLTDAQRNQCANGKANYSEAVLCVNALKDNLKNVSESLALPKLKAMLPALTTSMDYIGALENKEGSCKEELKNKGEISQSCFAEFTRDRAKLEDQILQLNRVKDKIGAQNVDAMRFRNFALQKWGTQKCQMLSAPMDFCEDESLFTKDASLTLSDTMKIAVLFTKSEDAEKRAEKELKPLCYEDRKETKDEERLCDFFRDSAKDVIEIKENKDKFEASTVAPEGGPDKIHDAKIQGVAQVLGSFLPAFMPNPLLTGLNQYPYGYNPYNNGAPPMGIAASIMYNARYYGNYGFYATTPGYNAYTAYGARTTLVGGAAGYTPVTGTISKYFTYY
jgi:hypothetical protein